MEVDGHDQEIRSAAQSFYNSLGNMNNYRGGLSTPSPYDFGRPHSINFITEEFLGGYRDEGRMSVVRRFFCLFVTFDLFFVSLLWLISIMINGDNIFNALDKQVRHYSIYTSLFDVVLTAICRFVILLLFYAILYINHWFIISLSTTGSCMFLISKVFVYDWLKSPEPVFQVVLIVTSFVLAWGEAWFLDCRVIPQERYARSYFSGLNTVQTDRTPLMAPFLYSEGEQTTESIANFYSPYETIQNSDDEDDEEDEEYKKMGVECVRKAYELLRSTDWKIEKVTQKGDTIQSTQREKLGKIYRLTARIKYPAKLLLDELFYKIEEVPKWNPTLLESKIVRKIDTRTDISYQATIGGGGGLVKNRDFVNLRCWRMCRDGKVIEDSEDEQEEDEENILNLSCEGSVSTASDNEFFSPNQEKLKWKSESMQSEKHKKEIYGTLSKSLGAKDFQVRAERSEPLTEDNFETGLSSAHPIGPPKSSDKIYVSAAFSIDYQGVPINPKYTRGQNLVSCWAMREIDGKPDSCIFEWLLCLDLKGYIPRYVLDTAYTTLMQDYMTYLRKYCTELRNKRKLISRRTN